MRLSRRYVTNYLTSRPNNALQRIAAKTRRPLNANVRARMKKVRFISALLVAASCPAEEPATFTLSTGISSGIQLIDESVLKNETPPSVRIIRSGGSYVVLVTAFIPCQGSFVPPWMSLGPNPTLVLQKERNAGFHSRGECLYKLKVSVASDRLTSKEVLYVVSGQEVVGHVRVP